MMNVLSQRYGSGTLRLSQDPHDFVFWGLANALLERAVGWVFQRIMVRRLAMRAARRT